MSSDPFRTVARALALPSPSSIIVEVGVYDGADTRRLHEAARKPVRHFAFEADPRRLEVLRGAELPADVELVAAAVGAVDGRAAFHLSGTPGDGDGSSSLRRPTGHLLHYPWIPFRSTTDVDVVTLDRFLADAGVDAVDLLWADVQGAERDLVAGARRILEATRFVFLESDRVELYEDQWTREAMLREMGAIGWGVVKEWDSDVLFYNRACFGENPL